MTSDQGAPHRRGRPDAPATLRTERLLLRHWRDTDLEPFAAMNADPEVMRFFPSVLTAEQSTTFAERIRRNMRADGWGLWAVEVPGVAPFIGFVGLARLRFEAEFTPAVEVGWRLARPYWGNGYAPEAARAALRHGFAMSDHTEFVSVTAAVNLPSRRVMHKIGMTHDAAADFEHPWVPAGSPLRPHVLYRITADDAPDGPLQQI